MTGKKVLLGKRDGAVEWEPIKEAYRVKLRTKGGKFLRANGAMPLWRNSVTHDLPHRTSTQDWVMWDVDVVDVSVLDDNEYLSPDSLCVHSGKRAADKLWPSFLLDRSAHSSMREDENGMEFFNKMKAVWLQSHLENYLIAADDETTQRQSLNGASRHVQWSVELVEGKSNKICLMSCHGLYLIAAEDAFLLGMTGKKVLQTMYDVAIEW